MIKVHFLFINIYYIYYLYFVFINKLILSVLINWSHSFFFNSGTKDRFVLNLSLGCLIISLLLCWELTLEYIQGVILDQENILLQMNRVHHKTKIKLQKEDKNLWSLSVINQKFHSIKCKKQQNNNSKIKMKQNKQENKFLFFKQVYSFNTFASKQFILEKENESLALENVSKLTHQVFMWILTWKFCCLIFLLKFDAFSRRNCTFIFPPKGEAQKIIY